MRELIARLEKATGPDRFLDRDIARRLDLSFPPPEYTGSFDAALTLMPERCDLEIYFDNPSRRGPDTSLAWFAQVGTPDGRYIIGKSDHGAIALCIAALKAYNALRDLGGDE